MEKVIDLRANGKLLITGEYLVLAGAKALALPVKFGQCLHAHPQKNRLLHWTSFQPDNKWFECILNPDNLEIESASNPEIVRQLIRLIDAARKLNPEFLLGPGGYIVTTELNYPVQWGLGSSSTIISMVADWAGVDAFDLFRLVSNGSGYDIACAKRNTPLFYKLCEGKPVIQVAIPGTALRKYAFFSWLGNKHQSKDEVHAFRNNYRHSDRDIELISSLSEMITAEGNVEHLCRMVNEHERILGVILKREPLARRFPGFPGVVKSLGAWGGDFAMFVSDSDPREVKNYLTLNNLRDVFTFDEIKAN